MARHGLYLARRAVALALVAGCSGGSQPNGSAPDGSVDAASEAVFKPDAGLDGHDGSTSTDADLDAHDEGSAGDAGTGPVVSQVVFTTNPNNVLSGVLTFTTDEPTTDQVQVTNLGDGGADNSFSVPLGGKPPTKTHSIAVLGLRADSPFTFDVTTTDAASRSATTSVDYTTGPLPAVIPPVQVVQNDKTRTSPGYTMLDLWAWTATPPTAYMDGTRSSIVIVDGDGQVVWYWLSTSSPPTDPKKLPNGDISFLSGGGDPSWIEIDMMGSPVRTYSSTQLGLDYLQHEIFPEPGTAHYLGLSSQLRSISGYPTVDGGTTTYSVVGDVVAEFDSDGGVLNQWSDFDMLDPHYEGDPVEFNDPYWNFHYKDAGPTKDWTHGNAVVVDPTDGNILASSRTLSWIYKFDRNDGGLPKLLWRLGPGGDFALTNTNDGFQYNQHGANVLPNGHVMAFDNGSDRPNDAGVSGLYSRSVEFSLDTTNMQATIVWQYQESPPFYSFFLGSSYPLPNGNVLICDGGEIANRGVLYTDPTNLKYARIMEVTHDAVPTKVMELDIAPPLTWATNFSGFSVYRAQRITSLY